MRHKFPVLTVKKWLKSVYIYGSYRKTKIGVPFFGPPCTTCLLYWRAVKVNARADIAKFTNMIIANYNCCYNFGYKKHWTVEYASISYCIYCVLYGIVIVGTLLSTTKVNSNWKNTKLCLSVAKTTSLAYVFELPTAAYQGHHYIRYSSRQCRTHFIIMHSSDSRSCFHASTGAWQCARSDGK